MSLKNFVPLKQRVLQLVDTFKYLETEQIYRFFEGCSRESINFALKTLKMDGYIYQSKSNTLTSINRNYENKEPDEIFKRAFYVMTSFGHENITFYDKIKLPKQIIFVAENQIYEVSAMTQSNSETLKSLFYQDSYKNKDDAINIIVVDNHTDGKEMLEKCGFDAYCLMDKDYRPTFYQE